MILVLKAPTVGCYLIPNRYHLYFDLQRYEVFLK